MGLKVFIYLYYIKVSDLIKVYEKKEISGIFFFNGFGDFLSL